VQTELVNKTSDTQELNVVLVQKNDTAPNLHSCGSEENDISDVGGEPFSVYMLPEEDFEPDECDQDISSK
jgi:hypothetical protein